MLCAPTLANRQFVCVDHLEPRVVLNKTIYETHAQEAAVTYPTSVNPPHADHVGMLSLTPPGIRRHEKSSVKNDVPVRFKHKDRVCQGLGFAHGMQKHRVHPRLESAARVFLLQKRDLVRASRRHRWGRIASQIQSRRLLQISRMSHAECRRVGILWLRQVAYFGGAKKARVTGAGTWYRVNGKEN